MQSNAKANNYSSQFAFDYALYNLIASANDGHFHITPCTYTIFNFFIEPGVVSIAESTTSQPKLYNYCEHPSISPHYKSS